MGKKPRDLTGQTFGRWTAIKQDERRNGKRYYLCQCACGTVQSVLADNLTGGKTKSCGCYRKEYAAELGRKTQAGREKHPVLIGQHYGNLTVEEQLPGGLFRCICDCGNEKIARGSALKRGTTRSCGCIRLKPQKDLTGQRFGRLTVIEYGKIRGSRSAWLCRCDCGNEKLVSRPNLINGSTRSCGCLRRDTLERLKKMGVW